MVQQELKSLYERLLSEWDKSEKNLDVIETIIKDLKLGYMNAGFMPCDKSELEDVEAFNMQQRTLEISALCSILRKDSASFLRKVLQLKHYYMETAFQKLHPEVQESPLKYEMIGLHLLCLLADNNRMQIHRELECLPPEVALNNPFINFAVKLEECLMVGAYSKLFMFVASPPSPYCAYFLEIMSKTIRNQIADSIAKSFNNLKVTDAARLLNFTGPTAVQDLKSYLGNRWKMSPDGNSYVFSRTGVSGGNLMDQSMKFARDQLHYARKLDMIV